MSYSINIRKPSGTEIIKAETEEEAKELAKLKFLAMVDDILDEKTFDDFKYMSNVKGGNFKVEYTYAGTTDSHCVEISVSKDKDD